MSDKEVHSLECYAREMGRATLWGDLCGFVWSTRKWWLVPVLGALLIMGLFLLLSSSAMAPFIYTLF